MQKPKRPSADITRNRIITAAKTLFLAQGFHATTTQSIAKKAAVHSNLIFHHFGTKAELWRQVKKMVLLTAAKPPIYDCSSAHAYFNSLIDYRFTLYRHCPDLVRLIQWQQVVNEQEELIGNDFASPNHWLDDIRDLQRRGEIIADIDAELILLFIVFSTHAPFTQAVIPLSDDKIERYKTLIIDSCLQQFIQRNH